MFSAYLPVSPDAMGVEHTALTEIQGPEWKGTQWRHRLGLAWPTAALETNIFLLEVTGDDAGAPDRNEAASWADATGLRIITLFDVPNQPIWDMREDDLIAHSFEQFLVTGDSTWPVLHPMVQAVVLAMDTVCAQFGPSRFIVTGASKRGWTTWLAAATGDSRIVGIVPRVFDNLDMATQMAKQEADWGDFSDRVGDYTRRKLQALIPTPPGQALLKAVDPVFSLDSILCPTLVVNGTNDDYWTVDALSVYAARLADARFVYVPNESHALPSDGYWKRSVGAFAKAIIEGEKLPSLSSNLSGDELEVNCPEAHVFRLWLTFSDSRHFDQCLWRIDQENQIGCFQLQSRRDTFTAITVEAIFEDYSLFTPIQVLLPLA